MNSNKNTLHNQKHLTLSDRTFIEQEVFQKSSFTSIAKNLKKDPTTIAKEIKRYSKNVPIKGNRSCNKCNRFKDCDISSLETSCNHYNKKFCTFYCKKCYRYNPTLECLYYIPFQCKEIEKPPYVCNHCNNQKTCPLTKKIYEAAHAQKQY